MLSSGLYAQITIQSIEFSGLKRTKADYLKRFLDTKVGATTNLKTLENDVQQLKNLNFIADGALVLDTVDSKLKVHFQLQEAFTIFPIINFGGIQNNFWYQLGFSDDNWLGRGQKLATFYQNNDRRHNFSLFYKIPYFNQSRWGASFSFLKWASIEPLYFDEAAVFYDYDNISFGLSAFYEIKRNSILELGSTYFIENYRKNDRHEGTLTPGPNMLQQPKSLFKLIHHHSNINYHFFYLSGFDNRASYQTVYNFQDNSWFHIFLNDTRYFRRVGRKGNAAARFRVGMATNNNTPFAPFVLDSYINIRGSGNRIERGTAALILNAEYRHTVWENPKFGAQVVAFSDLGSWRDPGGDLEDLATKESIQHFVGGGIRLIYKRAFNAIFRVDYGIDVLHFERRGVVFGIGQYF